MRLTVHRRLLLAALVLGMVLQPLAAFAGPLHTAGVGALELNDDPLTAPYLSPPPVSGNLDADGDFEDYFKVDLVAGEKIEVSLAAPDGFYLDLYDSTLEEPVAYADSYTNGTYVVPAGKGGTYYLDVYADYAAGSYTLDYSIGIAEQNDTYPGAAIPASPVVDDLSFGDSVDFYSVPLDAGEKIVFNLSGEPGTGFGASLIGPAAADDWLTWAYGDAYPYYGNYAVPAGKGGTYSIAVERWDGAGDYSLTWDIVAADADDTLPGADLPASPIAGSLDWRTDTDDVFSVDLTVGQRLTATLSAAAGTTNYGLYLYEPNTTDMYEAEWLDAAEDGAYPRQISFSAPTAGRYYLDVTAFEGFGDYTLTWSIGTTPPKVYESISGDNRFLTAIAASQKAFPGKAPAVVIATGENWPDALGGAALAAAKNGPILLTTTSALPESVKTELRRLAPSEVFVLGGTAAVSVKTFEQVKAIVPNTIRVWGDNRYQTAEAVARKVAAIGGAGFGGSCFITTGLNFPDALGASPLSAAAGMPILLSPPSGLTSGTLKTIGALKIDSVTILGGQKALPDSALESLQDYEIGTQRIEGGTRYQTAAKVAAWGHDPEGLGLSYDKVAIATGANFPDALAAGAMQAVDGSLLLLTPSGSLDPSVSTALSANKWNIDTVRFMGGVKALSNTVRNQVKAALALPPAP